MIKTRSLFSVLQLVHIGIYLFAGEEEYVISFHDESIAKKSYVILLENTKNSRNLKHFNRISINFDNLGYCL